MYISIHLNVESVQAGDLKFEIIFYLLIFNQSLGEFVFVFRLLIFDSVESNRNTTEN